MLLRKGVHCFDIRQLELGDLAGGIGSELLGMVEKGAVGCRLGMTA